MKSNKIGSLLLVIVLIAPAVQAQERIIKDDLGYPFDTASPPQRIVSLAPNVTEILFALGLGKRVVGVTRYCDFPEEAKEKDIIGGMVDPNLEKIHALNPDLIIGFRGNPLMVLDRIRNLDLPLFVLNTGTDIESVFSLINTIGTITDTEKRAELFIQSLRTRYQRILSSLRNVEHEPRVFISLHGMGLWTCGKESFLNDLVTKARGVNIAGSVDRKWLYYNQEQLIHQNPEVIVILSKSQQDYLKARNWIKDKAHLEETEAVASDRIFFLDENLATRPGPRLVEALEDLAHLLHPQHFEKK